jgi:hypothetical protein
LVVTVAGHDAYGAGQVVGDVEHARGLADVSHVLPCCEQFAHAAPF